MTKRRYIATIDVYVYAKNDEKAFAKAKKTAEKMNGKEDSRATVLELVEMPFASITPRKIKLS